MYPKHPSSQSGGTRGSTGLSTKPFQCRRGLAGLAQCALEMLSAHQTEQKGYFILFLNPFLSRKDSLRWQGESGGADLYLCSAPYTFIPAPILALPAQSLAAGGGSTTTEGSPPSKRSRKLCGSSPGSCRRAGYGQGWQLAPGCARHRQRLSSSLWAGDGGQSLEEGV